MIEGMEVRKRFAAWMSLCLVLMGTAMGSAQTSIKVDTKEDWEKWRFPKGVMEVTDDGWVKMAHTYKNINAALDAKEFSYVFKGKAKTGGATTGSKPQDAFYAVDGDSTTFWSPAPEDGDQARWIWLDLGRVTLATRIRMVFEGSLPPFSDFIVYISDGIARQGTNILDYEYLWKTQKPYTDHVFEYDLQPDPNVSGRALQHVKVFFPGNVQGGLAELEVYTLGENIALRTIERGGFVTSGSTQATPLNLFDGDLSSFWICPLYGLDWNQGSTTRSAGAWFKLDLGSVFWVDTFDLLQVARDRVGGAETDINGFKIYTSDGTPSSERGTVDVWKVDGRDVVWSLLGDVENTALPPQLNFELTFPPRRVRYVLFHHFYGTGTYRSRGNTGGRIFETQFYGEGAIPGVTMMSNILDMGGRRNIISVAWDGDFPSDTKMELRTRTGDALREIKHWYDDQGKEISEETYNRLPPFIKRNARVEVELAPVDSLWSNWSPAYSYSGAPFASPSPRQYLLCEVKQLSYRPDVAPSLNSITFYYTPPAVSGELVGEVGPWKGIRPASPQTFSFYTKSSGGTGYNRTLILAPAPAKGIGVWRQNASDLSWVKEETATFRPSGDSLFVYFGSMVRSGVVRIDLETTIFYNGSLFTAFVGNSSMPSDAWQRVNPGNATDEVDGSSTKVLLSSLPSRTELISDVSITPEVITPNGDGINDQMVLTFDVLKVERNRQVTVQIYDVAGTPVKQIGDWLGASNRYQTTWDGADEKGERVPPGLYLCRIEVDGDTGERMISKVVGVVY